MIFGYPSSLELLTSFLKFPQVAFLLSCLSSSGYFMYDYVVCTILHTFLVTFLFDYVKDSARSLGLLKCCWYKCNEYDIY